MKKMRYAPMVLVLVLILGLVGIYVLLDYGIVGVETSSTVDRIRSVSDPVKVHFIDVGQGDAILIQVKAKNILLDAGTEEAAPTILAYLKTYGVEKLDLVFLTHPHEDHVGGMGEVLQKVPFEEFYTPDKTVVTQSYERLEKALEKAGKARNVLKAGMSFDFGDGILLEVLTPSRSSYLNPNNYSPIMRLSYGNSAFLFTGDAEEVAETEALKTGKDLKADVLKAPHHGSATSSTQAFLDRVAPRFVVVTSEQGNDHNLPTPAILERYSAMGASVVLTEEKGTVVFSSNGKEVRFLSD